MAGVTRRHGGTALRVAAGALVSVTMMLPLLWMVATSLRERGSVPPRTLELVPDPVAWENYREIFDLLPLATMARNSVVIAAVAVPLSVLCASWAGFALALLAPRARRWLVATAFVAAMIPTTAFWVTRFVLFSKLGLVDTWWPLILPALTGTSPLFALIYLWSYLGVPRDVFDAARLDGAGAIRTWATIAFPLARPTTIAVAMLTFTMHWNNFTDPLIYIQSLDRQTLPFGLAALFQLAPTDWPLLMAASVLLTAPAVIVFLIGQRAFMPGARGDGWLGN
jgi:multiple sugar transport system permease protein